MNIGIRTHQPKGDMCTSCAKWREDCSSLPFETMPVIATSQSGINIVKCSEHERTTLKIMTVRIGGENGTL